MNSRRLGSVLTMSSMALMITACGPKPEPAPAPSPTTETPVSAVAAPATPDPKTAAYWTGIKYVIDEVPEPKPDNPHPAIPHLVKGGTIQIVDEKNGTFTLLTEGAGWQEEYQDVRLKFNDKGVRFCTPRNGSRAAALGLDPVEPAAIANPQKFNAAVAQSIDARRFLAETAVTLHKRDEDHEKHIISICGAYPTVDGKKEIWIHTIPESGGGHDGVSHGVQP